MSYTIPKTNKDFLKNGIEKPKIFNFYHKNTQNATNSIEISNPNDYCVECIFSLQAGSGGTGSSYERTDIKTDGTNQYSYYTYAGSAGASISLKEGETLLFSVGGGAGSPARHTKTTRRERKWRGTTKGWSSWSAWWNTHLDERITLEQEGESMAFFHTLKPKASITITFTHNGANNASNKGSVCVSGYC